MGDSDTSFTESLGYRIVDLHRESLIYPPKPMMLYMLILLTRKNSYVPPSMPE